MSAHKYPFLVISNAGLARWIINTFPDVSYFIEVICNAITHYIQMLTAIVNYLLKSIHRLVLGHRFELHHCHSDLDRHLQLQHILDTLDFPLLHNYTAGLRCNCQYYKSNGQNSTLGQSDIVVPGLYHIVDDTQFGPQ